MSNTINTGKKLKLIETDDIHKVPFEEGQYIIVDDGLVYYDPTTGSSIDDRRCLIYQQEIDVYERTDENNDKYYLDLHIRPKDGDLVIIKDLIPNTSKYSHTVYIYNDNSEDTNGSEWCQLTQSHSAKNVYFTKNIEISLPIDQILNEPKTIEAAGKNMEEVLASIFSPERFPKITEPTVELSFPKAGAYEIGTVVSPDYSMNLNPGTYEFGPNTGITAIDYEAVSSTGATKNSKSGTFASLTVDESTNFLMSATIVYSDGSIPVTSTGNEYKDGQIISSFVSVNSERITGYVNGLFYGCVKYDTTDNLNSDIIRQLNMSNKAYESGNVELLVPIGTKTIIIACPINNTGVTEIYNKTVHCDMTAAFGNPITVSVNGNSELPEYSRMYNVWTYSPAEPYEVTTNLTLTLS